MADEKRAKTLADSADLAEYFAKKGILTGDATKIVCCLLGNFIASRDPEAGGICENAIIGLIQTNAEMFRQARTRVTAPL